MSPHPQSGEISPNEFLAAHPEIKVGREALDKADEEAGGDSFSIVHRPLKDLILVQYYHADTLERLSVVAMVKDAKMEQYYERYAGSEDESKPRPDPCSECGAGSEASTDDGPNGFLHSRMVTCPDSCSKKRIGRIWPGPEH